MEVQTNTETVASKPKRKKAKKKVDTSYVHTRGREPGPFTSKVIKLKKGMTFIEKDMERPVLSSLLYRAGHTIFEGRREFSSQTKYNKSGEKIGIEVKRVA